MAATNVACTGYHKGILLYYTEPTLWGLRVKCLFLITDGQILKPVPDLLDVPPKD